MSGESSNSEKPRGASFMLDASAPPPFSVGLNINVQTAVDRYKKTRFPVYLAGWMRPHLLITYHQQFDTGILAIPKGTEMIARYIYEGQIYGFSTKLFHKQSEPFHIWFFEYPLEIEVINLRSSSRLPLTIEVKTADGELYFTKDISRQGASLMLSSQSPQLERKVGDIVTLHFKLPDETVIDGLHAAIVRLYTEHNHRQIGIKFAENQPRQLNAVSRSLEGLEKDFVFNPALFAHWDT